LHTAHTSSNTDVQFTAVSNTAAKMTLVHLASMVSYTNTYCMIIICKQFFVESASFLNNFKIKSANAINSVLALLNFILYFHFSVSVCLGLT
jgi:hypothetical protein